MFYLYPFVIKKGMMWFMRFVYINGENINADRIRSFWASGNGTVLNIEYSDDSKRRFEANPNSIHLIMSELSGSDNVIQVIPVRDSSPIFAVWNDTDSDDGYFYEPVYYLGLCSDGELKGLSLSGGYFELLDTASNFTGLYSESELKQFSNLKRVND